MAGRLYPNGQYPNYQTINRGYVAGEAARAATLNPCQNGGCIPPGACPGSGCGVPNQFPIPFNPAIHPLMSYADPGLVNDCGRPVINPYCQRRISATTWTVNYIAGNRENSGININPLIVDPWGIVFFRDQLWVCCADSDMIINMNRFGHSVVGGISIRDAVNNSSYPTGIAINCEGGFLVNNGTLSKSALLLACTESGTVHAYNPNVNATEAYVVINMQVTGRVSVFKGLAVVNQTLYLADFFQGRIQVFDSSYTPLTGYNFVDGDTSDPIPADYGPNNIVHIGGFLYVLWARRDENVTVHDFDGPGHGFISVFGLDGGFIRRFTSRGVLNSPWAMIPAPMECGIPPGSFLVGNNGDGRINIFDCSGLFIGPLINQAGIAMVIEGLWRLYPVYNDVTSIYFTAATNENIDGIVGCLVPNQRILT